MMKRFQNTTPYTVTNDGYPIGLRAQTLLQASPTHSGKVLMLQTPTTGFVSKIVTNQWRERELILCGNFLFRYTNSNSRKPRGTPMDLYKTQSRIIDEDSDEFKNFNFGSISTQLPIGIDTIFCVKSMGKSYFFAAEHEDAITWVNSINQARLEAIKRSLGHSRYSYPEMHKCIDELAGIYIRGKEKMKPNLNQKFTANTRQNTIPGLRSAASVNLNSIC